MKVQVREDLQEQFVGFYDYARRRPGDVFAIPDKPQRVLFPGEAALVQNNDNAKAVYEAIKDGGGKVPQHFSFRWMQPVAESAREVVTTSQQALDQRSAQIKNEKAGTQEADKSANTADVI